MDENINQVIEQPGNIRKVFKKKLVIFGLAGLGVILLVVFGFLLLNSFIYNEKQGENTGESMVDANPVMYFNPSSLNLTSGEIQIPIVQIMGDVPNPADTFKLDIQYDHLTISEVDISPLEPNASFLGTDAVVVTNTPNYQAGRAYFEIQTPTPVTGNGPIALLTFKPNIASPTNSTTLSFTTITSVENSVTGTTYPTASMALQITLPPNSTGGADLTPDTQEEAVNQQQ